MRNLLLTLSFLLIISFTRAQTATPNPRPLTLDEYNKALTYTIADLDKDTYVKFDNAYVLDRYENRKPYFITGGDGLKKRVDLYKLVAKQGMQEIGLMVFYTNETGKKYQALVPDFTADAKVWAKYFQDIDDINKVEKNFILKLSYVLSKEMAFQQYKVLNNGKDMKEEAATYGNDICFPGDEEVTMSNGAKKLIKDVKSGDEVITVDPATNKSSVIKVKELTVHAAKNYAITELVLVSAKEEHTAAGLNISLNTKVLKATPNHPMLTKQGNFKIGEVAVGQQVLCLNEQKGKYETYTVLRKTERAGGVQNVYNIEADGGSTLVLNGVMVMQK
ncbi:Hint domain-containing protein [Mucilaginibacter sp.]|uniref:Hint domain-containing protein n=1 Tax=Mucilaginibacter sp. TaxID=1882438 RepID=UPI0025DCAF50|nr:Hint domain-containing protein [Mucilaginibacter sp.]